MAEKLAMPAIRVMEVATFYTMFNLDPVGKHFIQFCGTTPCALREAGEIKKVLERRVGEERHVSDGLFSWLEVECLGACCNAPMVQINDLYYEDLTVENFERLLDDLAAGRPAKAGSQIGRRSSEPHEAVNTLTDPALYDGSVVGAWRKRFEEEAVKTPEAAAQTAGVRKAARPQPAAGRAIESDAADTPAKRVKEGEAPVKAADRKGAASRKKATVVEPRTERADPAAAELEVLRGDAEQPGRGQGRPGRADDPGLRHPARRCHHPPRRLESKPDVVVTEDNKSS